MSRSGSVEVRPRWNDRSESEQAQTFRHSDEIRLGDRVGRINSIRLDFAGLRAKLLGVGTCRIQRRVNRYAHTRTSRPSGGGDGDSFPFTSIPCRTPALPCRRLRTTQGGPPFHATALPYMQCMPCNARIACMACATRMPRKACVTRCDRTILLCTKSRLPAQIKLLSQVNVSERYDR